MINDLTHAGTGIDIVERAYDKATRFCTLDSDGNIQVNANTTRAQLCPIISSLNYALEEAQKVIDEIVGSN